MADEKVIIGIELDEKDTAKVSQNLKETFSKGGAEAGRNFGSSFSDSSSSFITRVSNSLLSMKGLIAGLSVGLAAAAAVAVSKFIDEAVKSEDAIKRLNTALILTGKYSDTTSISIQKYASELQGLTRYADDALVKSAALIQALGKLDEEGLKRAVKSTADLASGLGIDLETATNLVAKATAGNTIAFTRFGVAVEKGKTAAETFENTLRKIESTFGGAAAANVQTYSGRIEQLTNAQSDLGEEFGNLIIKSPAVREVIRQVTVSVAELTEKVKAFAASNIWVNFQKGVVDTGIFITRYIGGAIEILLNNVNVLWQSFKFLALDAALVVNTVFAKLFQGLVKGTPDFLLDKIPQIQEFSKVLDEVAAGTLASFTEQSDALSTSFNNILSTETTETMVANLQLVRDALDQTSEKMKGLKKAGGDTGDGIKKNAFDIAQAISQVAAKAIATGVQSMTMSLLQGSFAFKNFAKQVLSVVGDMAIQLGQTLILTGLGMNSLGELNGTKALIAGIGLVALGSIIKSYSGGGTEGAPEGAGGGGNFGFAGTTPEQTAFAQIQKEEEKTAVTVNIQGDVLDSEETGIKIVDLINQASSNSNVTINRRAFA
jgi:hypothetical protein